MIMLAYNCLSRELRNYEYRTKKELQKYYTTLRLFKRSVECKLQFQFTSDPIFIEWHARCTLVPLKLYMIRNQCVTHVFNLNLFLYISDLRISHAATTKKEK